MEADGRKITKVILNVQNEMGNLTNTKVRKVHKKDKDLLNVISISFISNPF